jgi:hypothetical protein
MQLRMDKAGLWIAQGPTLCAGRLRRNETCVTERSALIADKRNANTALKGKRPRRWTGAAVLQYTAAPGFRMHVP